MCEILDADQTLRSTCRTVARFRATEGRLRHAAHHLVHQHVKVGFGLLAATIGLTVSRWTVFTQPERSMSAVYLDVALLTIGLLVFKAGWAANWCTRAGSMFNVPHQAPGLKRIPRMHKVITITDIAGWDATPSHFRSDGSTCVVRQ